MDKFVKFKVIKFKIRNFIEKFKKDFVILTKTLLVLKNEKFLINHQNNQTFLSFFFKFEHVSKVKI